MGRLGAFFGKLRENGSQRRREERECAGRLTVELDGWNGRGFDEAQ